MVIEERYLTICRKRNLCEEREQDFVAAVSRCSEKRFAEDLRLAQKEYEQGQARIATLDKIMRKLYEDHAMERISEERFYKMNADYDDEQKSLIERGAVLKRTLDAAKKTESEHRPFSQNCPQVHGYH